MPKSSYLTLQEMGKILAYKDEGVGQREIARRLNRSLGCIQNYLRDPENYGGNKKRGPKKKTSQRDEQRIPREASNSSLSCKKIAEAAGVNVSPETIRRVLHRAPHIRGGKLLPCPKLEEYSYIGPTYMYNNAYILYTYIYLYPSQALAVANSQLPTTHDIAGLPDGFAILQEKYHEMRDFQSKMREK
jgi:hypothetical protein